MRLVLPAVVLQLINILKELSGNYGGGSELRFKFAVLEFNDSTIRFTLRLAQNIFSSWVTFVAVRLILDLQANCSLYFIIITIIHARARARAYKGVD